MRWKKLSHNDLGSLKQERVFLLLPLCLHNKCRWLEYATVEYVVDKSLSNLECFDWKYEWVPSKFID